MHFNMVAVQFFKSNINKNVKVKKNCEYLFSSPFNSLSYGLNNRTTDTKT